MTQAETGTLEHRLRGRLAELRDEYERGQHQLAALDARAVELRQTMLRIAGAIQVIEEAIGGTGGTAPA